MADTLQITPEVKSEDDQKAHEAAMVQKFDEAQIKPEATPPVVEADRPAWLPEGINTPEELVTKFNELQSKQPVDTHTDSEVPPADIPADSPKLDEFFNEFAETGSLTDDSYAKLEGLGLDRALVDSYIAGQQAQVAVWEGQVFSTVGGKENYQKITNWAKANLSEDEVAKFNDAVSTKGDAALLAVTTLKNRYEQTKGITPALLTGDTSITASGYESWAQVKTDMAKPEYRKDAAFRASVERKLAASPNIQ